jgi:hypothetical protein
MMAGTFINNQVTWPFTLLSGRSLKIRGLFSFCEYNNNVSSMTGLFTGLTLNNITGVFCCYLTSLTSNESYTVS